MMAMYTKFFLIALLLSALAFSVVPATYAQNDTNATGNEEATTEFFPTELGNDTATTGNDTGESQPNNDVVCIQAPCPGDETAGNETGEPIPFPPAPNETAEASNLTQVKEEAIPLLDEAETNIQDVRDLIRGLQEQLAAVQGPGEEITEDANVSATEIVDIVKENITDDPTTIDNVGNVTEDVVEVINGSITGNQSVTPEVVQNVSDTVVEIVDEATDQSDNTTITTHVDTAMIRLLTGLVDAQDYTALPPDQKAELKADLAETIADIASDSADKLS